jgi:hypothetical protein
MVGPGIDPLYVQAEKVSPVFEIGRTTFSFAIRVNCLNVVPLCKIVTCPQLK